MTTRVAIDRIVLHGSDYNAGERALLGQALRSELTDRLMWRADRKVRSWPTPRIRTDEGLGLAPRELGQHIADVVAKRVAR